MQKEAKEAGYYTVDEFAYQGRMTEWTPKSSQIMKAHEMGLTQQEYLDYMEHLAAGNTNAYTMAKDANHGSEQEERRLDDLHFQDELLAAGYDPTQGYASLEGDVVHGFEEEGFLRFVTDPFMYDYDHFDPGKKDATKAQQYISGRSPNYGATAPGAVVAKLDALKSQSVVRNEPGKQSPTRYESSKETVTPISTFRPPPRKILCCVQVKRGMETAIEQLQRRHPNLDRMM